MDTLVAFEQELLGLRDTITTSYLRNHMAMTNDERVKVRKAVENIDGLIEFVTYIRERGRPN